MEEELNEKLNIGKREIQKIKMTSLEKEQMFQNIMHAPMPTLSLIQRSFYSFTAMAQKHRAFSYIALSCLVIILGGGGVVYASLGSLPGNVLYPIKINLIEPANSFLKLSIESKAEYASFLATNRLIEAETLADQGKLDVEKENILTTLLEKHTVALEKNLERINKNKTIKKNNKEDENDKIITNFQSGMNAHASILDIIYGYREGNSENDDIEISKSARLGAGKIKDSFGNKDVGTLNKYSKKKHTIESLINKTTTNLSRDDSDQSEKRKRIIENTNKTLDKAKKFVQEAEDEDKMGDQRKAYSKLLEGETTAKEADIFLETGLKLKWKDNNQDD